MEYYESTCSQCNHTWRWTGYKTGIGGIAGGGSGERKTKAHLEQIKKAGTICPKCNGEAQVLDDFIKLGAKLLQNDK